MAKAVKKSAVSKKTEQVEYKYTVENLAKDLGIQPQSVRIALRKHEVAKAGKQYGWNSDKEYQSVLKKLQSSTDGGGKPTKKKAA